MLVIDDVGDGVPVIVEEVDDEPEADGMDPTQRKNKLKKNTHNIE